MAHIAIANAAVSIEKPHNRETSRTSTLIPQQLLSGAGGLVKLLKDYYDYLNTEGLPSFEINRIINNHDIDDVSSVYLDSIGEEIAKNVPNSNVLDRVALYKKIVKFYSIRGSEDSIYAFFRIFFDEAATVVYPKERLFKLSDGDWEDSAVLDEVRIVGSLNRGKLNSTSLNTIFDVKDATETVIGTGQLTDFVNVDRSFEYDNITDGLVMAFDSKENLSLTELEWISGTTYPWKAELENGVTYDESVSGLRFDGINDYIDLGALGDNLTITDEHTIVARVKRESAIGGGTHQCIFNATNALSNIPFEGHELYIDRDTGKIGRYWQSIGSPMIKESNGNVNLYDFKFYPRAPEDTVDNKGILVNYNNNAPTTFYKNTAYGGDGLYNDKPFYCGSDFYFNTSTTTNASRYVDDDFISANATDLFDGFAVLGTNVADWPCAKIYYDGAKWVFRGARSYEHPQNPSAVDAIDICYSEDTSEDAFSADLEWFDPHGNKHDFVNTPVNYDTWNMSTNAVIPADGKYYTIALTGNKARKGGYVKVSVDGGDWETIISGDTQTHLEITEESEIEIGVWSGGNFYFKGLLSHVQYYNSILNPSQVTQVKNYYIGTAYNFYQIDFDNQDGSYYNGATLVERQQKYELNLLTGHEIESFWKFDEPTINASGFGPSISVDAIYDISVSDKKQKIRWGDLRSNLFTSGNVAYHTYTTKDIGDYRDRKGFISDINRLHDGDFWQEFSYVINVGMSSNRWENEYTRMVHPAGLKFFAAVLYILNLDNEWIGANVEFNSSTRKYESIYDSSAYNGGYRTKNPLEDLDWMEGLTPPSLIDSTLKAYHLPLFQPGWLSGDERLVQMIIEAIEFLGGPNDPAYQRTVLTALRLLHKSTANRNEFAHIDYKDNLKFLDPNPITPYLYMSIEDAVDDNDRIFNNLRSTINLRTINKINIDAENDDDILTENNDNIITEISSRSITKIVLNPPEASRTYSSVYDDSPIGTGYARSMLDSDQAWSATTLGRSNILNGIYSEYVSIDLNQFRPLISGVVTQGRDAGYMQWVTSYRVQYSIDGNTWNWVDTRADFTGNTDGDTKVTNTFETPVQARYIRVYPVTFSGSGGGNWPSMRVGVVEYIST